jgi:hypothetical protein
VIDVPSNPPSRDIRDGKLAELHERLTASVEALAAGDDWRQALEFAARFRARSFNNAILIWSQHGAAFDRGLVPTPSPSFVAGFRQWQTLDRRVLAGQKGYMIFAPVTARFASSAPIDQASWRKLGRNERPRAGEVVRSRRIGTRPAYVWDVSQTDGAPIPARPTPTLLTGEAPAGLWNGLAILIHEAKFSLLDASDATTIGGANGITNFESRTVSVRADMDAAARAKTLVHELAHIRMHEPDTGTTLHRGIAEVEAESVALMVGAAHGMDTSGYTVPTCHPGRFRYPKRQSARSYKPRVSEYAGRPCRSSTSCRPLKSRPVTRLCSTAQLRPGLLRPPRPHRTALPHDQESGVSNGHRRNTDDHESP